MESSEFEEEQVQWEGLLKEAGVSPTHKPEGSTMRCGRAPELLEHTRTYHSEPKTQRETPLKTT